MRDRYYPVRRIACVAVVVLLLASGLGSVAVTATQISETTPDSDVKKQVAQPETCDFNQVYDDVIPSVVTVRVFDQGGDRGVGSGWVYRATDSTALVVTNAHVVEGSIGADVRFGEGEWRNVQELVGVDPYADLAVLRIENVPDYAESLRVAESLPDQGDEVAALGSPLGLEGSITRGIVSAVDRSVTVQAGKELYTVVDAIQIDTPISPGNSGGPLVDCDGNVVGVNFAGVSPLAGQDINFALSAAMVERITPELVENGTYNHSYLGIQALTLSPTMSRVNDIDGATQGVLVDTVVAGGPADGVLQGSPLTERVTSIPVGGDVIVAVDGTEIGDVDDLRDYLFEATRPGDSVTMTVLRNGDREQVELTIAPQPLPRERAGTEEPSI